MNARMYLITLIFCIFTTSTAWANNEAPKNNDGLSIVVTSLKVDDKIFQINYEVVNNSKQEIWIIEFTQKYT